MNPDFDSRVLSPEAMEFARSFASLASIVTINDRPVLMDESGEPVVYLDSVEVN